MPHYYFDVEDGALIVDAVGASFRSLVEARAEAVRRSLLILGDDSLTHWAGEPWLIRIKNDWGLTVFTLHFTSGPGGGGAARSPSGGESSSPPVQDLSSATALDRAVARYRGRASEMSVLAQSGSTPAVRAQHRELETLWLELAEAMEANKPPRA